MWQKELGAPILNSKREAERANASAMNHLQRQTNRATTSKPCQTVPSVDGHIFRFQRWWDSFPVFVQAQSSRLPSTMVGKVWWKEWVIQTVSLSGSRDGLWCLTLTLSFSLSPGLQPIGLQTYSYSCVFPPQLTQSRPHRQVQSLNNLSQV